MSKFGISWNYLRCLEILVFCSRVVFARCLGNLGFRDARSGAIIACHRRAVHRWRPYRVECTGSLPTSEVKRRRARLVLGWGTAREDLRVLPAFFNFRVCWLIVCLPLCILFALWFFYGRFLVFGKEQCLS